MFFVKFGLRDIKDDEIRDKWLEIFMRNDVFKDFLLVTTYEDVDIVFQGVLNFDNDKDIVPYLMNYYDPGQYEQYPSWPVFFFEFSLMDSMAW